MGNQQHEDTQKWFSKKSLAQSDAVHWELPMGSSPLFYGERTMCIRTGHAVLKQQYRSTRIFQPEKYTGPFSAK